MTVLARRAIFHNIILTTAKSYFTHYVCDTEAGLSWIKSVECIPIEDGCGMLSDVMSACAGIALGDSGMCEIGNRFDWLLMAFLSTPSARSECPKICLAFGSCCRLLEFKLLTGRSAGGPVLLRAAITAELCGW